MEALPLVVAPLIGLAIGRWWIAPTLGAIIVALSGIAAVADNYVGTCDRPDGCGAGPAAQILLVGFLYGAVIAALAAAGVLIRQRVGTADGDGR